MRVIDLINQCAETTHMGERNNLPTKNKNFILDALNIEYEKIYRNYPWDNVKVFNVSATTSDGILILPSYVESVRAARITTSPLLPIGELFINNFKPENFDEAGTPTGYTFLPKSPVLTQPTTATTITFVSDST